MGSPVLALSQLRPLMASKIQPFPHFGSVPCNCPFRVRGVCEAMIHVARTPYQGYVDSCPLACI